MKKKKKLNKAVEKLKQSNKKVDIVEESKKKIVSKTVKCEEKKTKGTKRQRATTFKENNVKVLKKQGKNKKVELSKGLSIQECGFNWNDNDDVVKKEESSSSEDEDISTEPKQKKKKLTAAERQEQERQKEREIRQREEALASNDFPNSVDQFDRLVLANPNSSLIWLQYMAYHLQATEIEKARSTAKRALTIISFREEDEKFNVWQAWLNLEFRFGSPESLNKVLQEAVQVNEPKKIYLHMLTIYRDAGKHDELERIIKIVTAKFKTDPQIWTECGFAYLKAGLKDKSRYTMQRALQSLPENIHVSVIVKFAHLENKYGDKDRAKTLFEQILVSYPKRIDVWTSYVDSLVKALDFDSAR